MDLFAWSKALYLRPSELGCSAHALRVMQRQDVALFTN
jgi:hypothetical protein